MIRRTVIAYWLIPTEPALSYFQSVISDLAQRHNAPVFEPHMTIHVGANCTARIDGVLLKTAQRGKPVVLQPLAISCSSEFTKTLFVQFRMNTQLQTIGSTIRVEAPDSSGYKLNPHLSLLYHRIPIQDGRRLARSIEVPFREVTFDSLKAVRCVSPTRSRADVEAWRVVATKKFPRVAGLSARKR